MNFLNRRTCLFKDFLTANQEAPRAAILMSLGFFLMEDVV
jgi:hypothetical protein